MKLGTPEAWTRRAIAAMAVAVAGMMCTGFANAALVWDWGYTGAGVDAWGTMTTTDVANSEGFFEITGIAGMRNGDAITTLQATGTSIPGNEPFVIDNLIKASGELSGDGFGYGTQSGSFANVFFADWASPPGVIEFATRPSEQVTSELPVAFRFAPSVPEPSTFALAVIGALVLFARRRHGASVHVDHHRDGSSGHVKAAPHPVVRTNAAKQDGPGQEEKHRVKRQGHHLTP